MNTPKFDKLMQSCEDRLAFQFVGWMRSAAKVSPEVAKEMEEFADGHAVRNPERVEAGSL